MKKNGFTLIDLMISIAIIAILAAMAAPIFLNGTRNGKRSTYPEYRGSLVIYTDPDTGCQYIQSSGDRQLTPRLGPDGHQLCHINH